MRDDRELTPEQLAAFGAELDALRQRIEAVRHHPRLAGIGEIGLDHFVPGLDLVRQQRFFEAQLAMARDFDLPVRLVGTPFQERVWQALREIPPGSTMSYAEVAERIGAPRAVRAVANACASNRLAVAVPCHRVVRQDGHLSGYRWGVARKRELLRREGWSEPASQYDEPNNLK